MRISERKLIDELARMGMNESIVSIIKFQCHSFASHFRYLVETLTVASSSSQEFDAWKRVASGHIEMS